MLQEALFSVISSLQEWEVPFLVCFLPLGIELLSQLTTFPFLSLNPPILGWKGPSEILLCPKDLPSERLSCATGAFCTSWTVHTHKVGYFKLLKFSRASLARGGDPGFPAAKKIKKKIGVMNQIFCKSVAILTAFRWKIIAVLFR